jgi:hypothetical protein
MALCGGLGARAGHTGQNGNGNLLQREDNRRNRPIALLEAYQRGAVRLVEFYGKLGWRIQAFAAGPPNGICERTIASPESLYLRLHRYSDCIVIKYESIAARTGWRGLDPFPFAGRISPFAANPRAFFGLR